MEIRSENSRSAVSFLEAGMKDLLNLGTGLVFLMVCLFAGGLARLEAKETKRNGDSIQFNASDTGGVVTTSKGSEAGVWVVAPHVSAQATPDAELM
jgi:hypothetical protein